MFEVGDTLAILGALETLRAKSEPPALHAAYDLFAQRALRSDA